MEQDTWPGRSRPQPEPGQDAGKRDREEAEEGDYLPCRDTVLVPVERDQRRVPETPHDADDEGRPDLSQGNQARHQVAAPAELLPEREETVRDHGQHQVLEQLCKEQPRTGVVQRPALPWCQLSSQRVQVRLPALVEDPCLLAGQHRQHDADRGQQERQQVGDRIRPAPAAANGEWQAEVAEPLVEGEPRDESGDERSEHADLRPDVEREEGSQSPEHAPAEDERERGEEDDGGPPHSFPRTDHR